MEDGSCYFGEFREWTRDHAEAECKSCAYQTEAAVDVLMPRRSAVCIIAIAARLELSKPLIRVDHPRPKCARILQIG